jgi:TetR/AcrR family transcriptional repressor of nem operon
MDSGLFVHSGWNTQIAPSDDCEHPITMRYGPEHKLEIHRKIVKDASRRVRAEGLNGAAVSAVMKDAGLTHGGFYKHFKSKDDLLLESLREGFREIEDTLAHAAEQSPPGEAWKAVVRTYLSLELCDHPERGQPVDKERAFFAIFSTMIGAIDIARLLPDRAMREKVLLSTTEFLLSSF